MSVIHKAFVGYYASISCLVWVCYLSGCDCNRWRVQEKDPREPTLLILLLER